MGACRRCTTSSYHLATATSSRSWKMHWPSRPWAMIFLTLASFLKYAVSFQARAAIVGVEAAKHAARAPTSMNELRGTCPKCRRIAAFGCHVTSPASLRRKRPRSLSLLRLATTDEGGDGTPESIDSPASRLQQLFRRVDFDMPRVQTVGSMSFKQRIESIKAAVVCGGIGSTLRLLAVGTSAIIPSSLREILATPEPTPPILLFCLASGFVQGALFGLTYRYVVRSDRQKQSQKMEGTPKAGGLSVDHLGDGCVAAFALTSALGQSEVPLSSAAGSFLDALGQDGGAIGALTAIVVPLLPFLPRAAGDLVLYSAARGAIDLALEEGVIESFP